MRIIEIGIEKSVEQICSICTKKGVNKPALQVSRRQHAALDGAAAEFSALQSLQSIHCACRLLERKPNKAVNGI